MILLREKKQSDGDFFSARDIIENENEQIFSKLYFAYSKETLNKSIEDFKNWNKSPRFEDLFEKIKSMLITFCNKINPTYNLKKHMYTMFIGMVSTSS